MSAAKTKEVPVARSIRVLIRQMIEDTNLADPREIAAKILAELDPAEYESVLAEALPVLVRNELSLTRMEVRFKTGAAPAASDTPTPSKGKQAFRSRKVAGYRSMAQRLRAMRVLGDKAAWKTLDDCAEVDLVRIVEHNREQAERNTATAEQYALLLAKLKKSGKKFVRELSDGDIESAFGGAE